jgi:hypothetical protein
MPPKYSYVPEADVGYRGTQNALKRWLDRQKQSREQFAAAEQPLLQAATAFQPGGTYGRGQQTLLREEARRAGAEATAAQVASGMSSGSLATGTKLRTERDLATGLAGVEDQRTAFLNQILSQLSGLRGTQAQTTAATVDPTFAPTMGYLSSRFGQVAGLNQAAGAGGSTYGQYRPLPTLAGRGSVSATRPTYSTPRY